MGKRNKFANLQLSMVIQTSQSYIHFQILQSNIMKNLNPVIRYPAIDFSIVLMSWIVLSLHVSNHYTSHYGFIKGYSWIDNLPKSFFDRFSDDTGKHGKQKTFHQWDFCLYVYHTFNYQWNMPFFFFIGGMTTYLSLNRYKIEISKMYHSI